MRYIGFNTVQVSLKSEDGYCPDRGYPEKAKEITAIIYQDKAAMLQTLYGKVE